MSSKFDINLSALDYNLKNFDPRARRAIGKVMQYQAGSSETWMRVNAPWTDRTTNARNGLFAVVDDSISINTWLLILSHTVSYGFWLEVLNNGQYAIVRPAWIRANREVMKRLSKVFELMEKGR